MTRSQYTTQYKRVRELLKNSRTDRGLSKEEASKLLGRYRTYVGKVESGERRIDIVEMSEICRLYRISAKKVLGVIGLK